MFDGGDGEDFVEGVGFKFHVLGVHFEIIESWLGVGVSQPPRFLSA